MYKQKTKIRLNNIQVVDGIIHEQPEGSSDVSPENTEIRLGIQLSEPIEVEGSNEVMVQVYHKGTWEKAMMTPPRAPSYKNTFVTILKANKSE